MLESNYRYVNELVNNVKKGDMKSLEILCKYYDPLIKAAVNRTIKRDKRFADLKEDLYTEAFLLFKDFCNNFDLQLSYFSYYVSTRIDAYLLSRAKQLVGHSEKIEIQTDLYSLEIETTDELYDPLNILYRKNAIESAIEQLPEELQQVIDYYYYKNLNQGQCAELLKMSQPTFSRKLKKSLELLKKYLPEDLYE